jgi:hypothetical protein
MGNSTSKTTEPPQEESSVLSHIQSNLPVSEATTTFDLIKQSSTYGEGGIREGGHLERASNEDSGTTIATT